MLHSFQDYLYSLSNTWRWSWKLLCAWKPAKSTFFVRSRRVKTSQIKIWYRWLLTTKWRSMPCESPPVHCKVFDGPALANILSPENNCKSFTQYAKEVSIPYLKFHTKSVQRLELVFDCYLEDSLKTGTQSNRGTGIQWKVTENGILPSNWKTFLRCTENKKELFPFLSTKNTIDRLKD